MRTKDSPKIHRLPSFGPAAAAAAKSLQSRLTLWASRRVLFKDGDAKTYLRAVEETHWFSQLQLVGWRWTGRGFSWHRQGAEGQGHIHSLTGYIVKSTYCMPVTDCSSWVPQSPRFPGSLGTHISAGKMKKMWTDMIQIMVRQFCYGGKWRREEMGRCAVSGGGAGAAPGVGWALWVWGGPETDKRQGGGGGLSHDPQMTAP